MDILKEKGLIRFGFYIIVLFLLLAAGCSNNDDSANADNALDYNVSFIIEKKNNPNLKSDIWLSSDTDTLYAFIPDLEKSDSIIVSFYGNYDNVEVGGFRIHGFTFQDFNHIVKYDFTYSDGTQLQKYVKIIVGSGIPRLEIMTENNAIIDSKINYVKASFSLKNCPDYGPLLSEGKIRGRGNATWNYPKKPYKIKFENKMEPMGMALNKDWVLLADYCDKSLMRSIWMFEASKAVGMNYTPDYRHVDLYLNNEYQGTYLMTELIEEGSKKVNVEDDGFIIECDGHYLEEPCYFITEPFSTPYTFKYPDADKHKIIEGDQNYKYIESYMNELENALTRISLGDMTYRKYIDLHSFAKWFVAQEAIANWDSNMYFVMKSKVDKLEMGPFWDAEWCLGLADWNDKDGWLFAPNLPRVDAMIWGIRGDYYFKYMLKDLDFVRLLQEEWESFKIKIPIIKEKIRQESSFIKYSQQRNFKKWPILDEYVRVGLVALGDWQLEVDYTLNFFDQRVKWCDEYFNKIVFEGLSQN